ncbi:MAG: sugar phosphate isomerase/epimerase [Firmicutes bacterium]|nr:sugar phosphate isomerase/epimerase [Bacillota bacterium]
MRIGISTGSFFPKKYTEDTFDLIRELDINCVEVFLSSFCEYTPEFAQTLLERKGDLEIFSVHTLNQNFEPELFNSSERTRTDCEFFYKQTAHVAKVLNAKYYVFHGPARLGKRVYNINYETFGARCTVLNGMLKELGGGCELLYENVHWAFFSSPDFYLNLKKHTEIGACLDIKQAMQSGISVYDYINAMGGRLKNVHLCDFDDNGKLLMPGKGTFDFVKLFRTLYSIGYNGPLMIEVYSGAYQDFNEIKDSVNFLNDCLRKAK